MKGDRGFNFEGLAGRQAESSKGRLVLGGGGACMVD